LALTEADLVRYERQISYPRFGQEGQERLKASRVVVAGMGGLGCCAALYLTYAGVGHISLVDCDVVESSNLNRQVLHWEEDLGEKKPYSALRKLSRVNSSIDFDVHFERITENNARAIVRDADAVIDGLDNFETRFILNSACVAERVPFIHAGVRGLLGEITTIIPGRTPCLACIFPVVPQQRMVPVFGVTPALLASLQTTEAIKLITGFDDLLAGKMLYIDAEKTEFRLIDLTRRLDCEVCGEITRAKDECKG
jgi:adenylyltransferase/sulfurtransferase